MSTPPPLVRRAPRQLPLRQGAALVAAAIAGLAAARAAAIPLGAWCLFLLLAAALVFAGRVRGSTVACAALYAGVLAWAYDNHFVPLFRYTGMEDAAPPAGALFITIALAALPAAWLPVSAMRPSTVVLWSLYIIGFVPAMVVPIYLTGRLDAVLPLDAALVSAMLILGLIVRVPPVTLTARRHLSLTSFTRLLAASSLAVSLYVLLTFGLQAPPSLSGISDVRRDFGATVEGGHWVAAYAIPWAGNVINPLLFSLGIARRRPVLIIAAIAGESLIYSVTGLKSVLFAIALVPIIYLAISMARRWYGPAATLGTSLLFMLAVAGSAVTATWSITLLRRLFAVPGQMHWYYFEYFSNHPHYELAQTRLGGLFSSSPYTVTSPDLIGATYFPGPRPHANAGVWADAFANFGFSGIIVFALVLGAVLWVIDGVGHRRDPRVIGPMLALAGLTLSDSALLTTLLTLGLGFGCAVLFFMPPGSIGRPARRE